MPRNEITNNRPKNYSLWHRKLPDWCYQTDGDFFEQRIINNKLVVVAYIETLQIPDNSEPNDYPIWNSKIALAEEITERMGIDGYFVWHYPDCRTFFVKKVNNIKIIKMCGNEYKEFLKGLK